MELYRDLVKKHDSHATLEEAQLAARRTVRNAGPNKFQHFWEDGIRERGMRQEEVSLRRRKVLIGVAGALHSTSTVANVVKQCSGAAITESEIRMELADFHRRKVLQVHGEEFRCTVKLFEEWLRESGTRDIITTVTDPGEFFRQKEADERLRVTSEELVELCQGWPNYRGARVGEERVRAWLEQFDTVEQQRLMYRLLRGVSVVSEMRVRSLVGALHVSVEHLLSDKRVHPLQVGKQRKRQDLCVCFLGIEGKSGNYYARIYAEHNRLLVDRIVELSSLGKLLRRPDAIAGVIVVDDFVGSGGTLAGQFKALDEETCELLRERNTPIVVAALIGFNEAADRIEEVAAGRGLDVTVRFGEPLDNSQRAFHADSLVFPDSKDRMEARLLAESIGRRLVSKHPLGFGQCEALVVFERQCPNNALPILWKTSEKEGWTALFPREL